MIDWPTVEEAVQACSSGDGSGIRIAILDSGIDPTHPDLSNAPLESPLTVQLISRQIQVSPNQHGDVLGHGTAIAGIIHSLAPNAVLLDVNVLTSRLRQHRHEIVRMGAMTAIQNEADILNCSFGVPATSVTLPIYKEWTDNAYYQGCHVIAAAGYRKTDSPNREWPAGFPQVISVAAGRIPSEQLRYHTGSGTPFEAAGVEIRTLAPGGSYETLTGSSFAAAHISGLLARLLSQFPKLPPSAGYALLRAVASYQATKGK